MTTDHLPDWPRERTRKMDEALRGPVLCWETLTGRVYVTVLPDVPGFPEPATVLEELGTVPTIGGEHGPWNDDFWTAPVRLAEAAGWHRAARNVHGAFAPHHGWRRSIDGKTELATLDRTASSEAMARQGDALARLGVAIDVPGPEAELVRRMRSHRDAVTERDALIDAGIALGMGDREIGREMGIGHVTVFRRRSGYFAAKARSAFQRAGGDPDKAGDLAKWAQAAHAAGNTRAGVVVTDQGEIVAETLHTPGTASTCGATYVVSSEHAEVRDHEVGLAMGALSRITGRDVIHVRYSEVCQGAGRYA